MAKALQSPARAWMWTLGGFCAIFVGIQFIRPELNNPPTTADLQASPEVKQILQNSCYSCHSNQTRLPWFDEIAPAYWIVTHDVEEGRKHLNFSEIGKLPGAQQKAILFEAVDQIELDAMPPPAYRHVHSGSVVTPEQLAVLKQYLNPATLNKVTTATDRNAADTQYNQWIQANSASLDVHPAPNGIAFMPDYKNWKAISSTERFDNQSLRVILGNDIAVKAIAENHINPWPDGTAFAKVAWLQQPDKKGFIRIGPSGKWNSWSGTARTKNWGWARRRGTDLKPYGKDADFTSECIGCHTPVRKNDYVFTMPIKGQQ